MAIGQAVPSRAPLYFARPNRHSLRRRIRGRIGVTLRSRACEHPCVLGTGLLYLGFAFTGWRVERRFASRGKGGIWRPSSPSTARSRTQMRLIRQSGSTVESQWWEIPSTFEHDLRELASVRMASSRSSIEWGGDDSELERRCAGLRLSEELRELEARNEPYCVIGHSHGGSVVSTASAFERGAQAAAAKPGKRWITVGTPFGDYREELWLLTRLSLIRKVIFVASMMSLLMFLVYLFSTSLSGETNAVWRKHSRGPRCDRRHVRVFPPSSFISHSSVSR